MACSGIKRVLALWSWRALLLAFSRDCSVGASVGRDELLVALTDLTLTLDEIEFADMVVVAESDDEQAAIAESVFAGWGLQWARQA